MSEHKTLSSGLEPFNWLGVLIGMGVLKWCVGSVT